MESWPGVYNLYALHLGPFGRFTCIACWKGLLLQKNHAVCSADFLTSRFKFTQNSAWLFTPLCVNRLPCRYPDMLEEILKEVDLTEDIPRALAEHRAISNTDCGPDQTHMFVSEPHAGTESIDLLMCAASMGNESALSALIRAGMAFVLQGRSN